MSEVGKTFADSLMHYGVKGMKWGVRKDPARTSSAIFTKRGRQARNAEIDKQRQRLKSGEIKSAYKDAKAQFKSNKSQMGYIRARMVLNAHKKQRMSDLNMAMSLKTGRELTTGVLIAIGATAVEGLLKKSR